MRETVVLEREVVGAILAHGRTQLLPVMDILKPEHFVDFELSELYGAMLGLEARGREITPGSVIHAMGDALTTQAKIALANAAKSVFSVGGQRDNARRIVDGWKLREAKKIAMLFGEDEFDDVSEYIAMYADMMHAVAGYGDDDGVKPWRDVLERAKKAMFSPVSERRIHTGFQTFDRLLGGTDPTDLMLIAARPAVGKTAFKEQIVRHLARGGRKILNVSLEMPDEQLAERQTAALANLSLSDIRKRNAAAGPEGDIDRDRIEAAMDAMKDWNIDVYDTPRITPMQLTRLVKMRRYDVVLVDYGGLMQADSRTLSRQEEVAAISRGLRALALGCRIQVIVLLQLNRQVEARKGGLGL